MTNIVTAEQLNEHREVWARIAKAHGWYTEPFFVQVWVDPDTNEIYDSVSFTGITQDIVVVESEEWGE